MYAQQLEAFKSESQDKWVGATVAYKDEQHMHTHKEECSSQGDN